MAAHSNGGGKRWPRGMRKVGTGTRSRQATVQARGGGGGGLAGGGGRAARFAANRHLQLEHHVGERPLRGHNVRIEGGGGSKASEQA